VKALSRRAVVIGLALCLLVSGPATGKKRKKKQSTEPAPVVCYDAAIDGSVAFLGQTLGLSLWDVSDPGRPRATYRLELPATVRGVSIIPPFAYLAAGTHGMYIARLIEDGPPELVTRFDTPGKVRQILSIGQHALVADEKHGLLVVDVSDPARALQKAQVPTRGQVRSMALWQDVVALAEGSAGVRLFDVSRPEAPKELALIRDVKDARDVDFDGRRLLVAAGPQGLRVYRFDRGWKPELAGNLGIPRSADYLAADEDVVLVSNATPTLFVVLLDDRDRPSLLTETRLHRSAPVHRVRLEGSRAIAALDRAGLSLIDMTDPTTPQVLLPRERELKILWPERDDDAGDGS
jgi:hypothetical protein